MITSHVGNGSGVNVQYAEWICGCRSIDEDPDKIVDVYSNRCYLEYLEGMHKILGRSYAERIHSP